MARKTMKDAKPKRSRKPRVTETVQETDLDDEQTTEDVVQEENSLENAARKAYDVLNHYSMEDSNIEGVNEARRGLRQALGL